METLRKYWRVIRQTKKFSKIIAEIKRYKNELHNNNLKLLSCIRVKREYVSYPSKKIEYFLNKHIIRPKNKTKKINVNDMSSTQKISNIINTFISCFPKKRKRDN